MTTRRPRAIAALLAATALCAVRAQTPSGEISYHFKYAQPGDAAVSVEITWPIPLAEERSLVMPRAVPMGYGEQHYDAFVTDVRAFSADGRTLTAVREEGPRWRLGVGTTRVAYRVDLRRMEQDVRTASDQSRVRDGYLGALGYSVFAYVDGDETRPTRLLVEAPPAWPVFSTLAPSSPGTTGPLDARAPDFYALADSQIVMGPRAIARRLGTAPAPLYFAVYSEGTVDLDRVGRLASTAFQRVADYFGTVPFRHYTVHYELLVPLTPQHNYGMSMEHLDSSTYYLSAASGLTSDSPAEDEARVLYNFAHHMAHAWVPKRLYGHGYFPFQWEVAPVLDSIWFAEGFGQYAAIMALAAQMPDPSAFRQELLNRRFRSNLSSAPPFLKNMPLVDLSRVASTRYSEDFRIGRLVYSAEG